MLNSHWDQLCSVKDFISCWLISVHIDTQHRIKAAVAVNVVTIEKHYTTQHNVVMCKNEEMGHSGSLTGRRSDVVLLAADVKANKNQDSGGLRLLRRERRIWCRVGETSINIMRGLQQRNSMHQRTLRSAWSWRHGKLGALSWPREVWSKPPQDWWPSLW